jgi:hypothetical protein
MPPQGTCYARCVVKSTSQGCHVYTILIYGMPSLYLGVFESSVCVSLLGYLWEYLLF